MSPAVNAAIVIALAAVGLGLLIFNLVQARNGWRQMKQMDRNFRASNALFSLIEGHERDLKGWKAEFDRRAGHLPEEERTRLWKPVDEHTVPAIRALMGGNSRLALSELTQAAAKARQVAEGLLAAV